MNPEGIKSFLSELPSMKDDLPYSPGLLSTLFMQTDANSFATMEEIGATISQDQGLTARLLNMANSAYYGLQSEVSSISRATAVLGLTEIRNIVILLGVKSISERYPIPAGFDIAQYWHHQLAVAEIAKYIEKVNGNKKSEILFTAGLLHDIGKLITALRRPEDWTAMRELAAEKGVDDNEAEDLYWGMDHAVIGSLVLKYWDLPEILVEAVNWHHVPRLATAHKRTAAIVSLANAAVHALAEGPSHYYTLCEDMAPKLCWDTAEDFLEDVAGATDMEAIACLASHLT